MNGKLFALLCVLAIAAISTLATFAPTTFSFLNYIPWGDKVGHFVLFGLLTLALVWAIPGPRQSLYGALLAAILVTIEETIQIYAPTRTFSVLDLVASLSGVAVFAIIGHKYRAKVRT